MKQLIIATLILFCFSAGASAQYTASEDTASNNNIEKGRFWDKAYFGGGMGAQFGNITFINLSPLIGYKFTPKISAGVTITYTYLNYKDYQFSTSIYGGGLFSRYYILPNLFTHGEYEVLNLDTYDLKGRIDVTSILVGGGYRQSLGGRSSVNMMALWNLNQSVYSPYQNPIIRVGVGFGI